MAKKRLFAFLTLSFILAAVLLVVSLGAIFISIHIPTLARFIEKDYSFRYCTAGTQSTVQKRFSYDADFIYRNENLYMDFSVLAELCGFAVSGDFDQRRYLLGNEEKDSLTVNIGTTSVVVSGQPLSLRTPSFLSESGSLYLPCEFVDSYFDGISIETDEKNERLIRVFYDTEIGYSLTIHELTTCGEVAPPETDD